MFKKTADLAEVGTPYTRYMLPTSYIFTRCVVRVMYDDGIRGINVGAAQRELFFAIVSLQKMPPSQQKRWAISLETTSSQ